MLPHLFQLANQLFLRLAFSCFPGGQVAKLFQDSSLGNAVNIVVTRLILLMEDQVSEPLDVVTLVGLVTCVQAGGKRSTTTYHPSPRTRVPWVTIPGV